MSYGGGSSTDSGSREYGSGGGGRNERISADQVSFSLLSFLFYWLFFF